MNIKGGLKRVYIILASLWFLFFAFIGITDKDLLCLCIGAIPPIIVYCLIVWVVKGFKS